MKLMDTVIKYSIVAVAGVALAACGSDHNRTASANNADRAAQTDNTTTAGTAQGANTADRTANANVSTADREFMMKAAQGGMAEVEMGRMAQEKGSSAQVKDYGRKLVDDHTKANDELKSIAGNLNVTLPTEVDSKDRSEMDKLSKLSGARFDREFSRHEVQDHQKDIKEFQHEADHGDNPTVKGFASKTIPTLQEHLTMAQSIQSGRNSNSNADRSSTTSGNR